MIQVQLQHQRRQQPDGGFVRYAGNHCCIAARSQFLQPGKCQAGMLADVSAAREGQVSGVGLPLLDDGIPGGGQLHSRTFINAVIKLNQRREDHRLPIWEDQAGAIHRTLQGTGIHHLHFLQQGQAAQRLALADAGCGELHIGNAGKTVPVAVVGGFPVTDEVNAPGLVHGISFRAGCRAPAPPPVCFPPL